MNRGTLLTIVVFLVTCVAVSMFCNIGALVLGVNMDPAIGQGPGRAGSTPGALGSGVIAFGVACLAAYQFTRRNRQ